MVAAFDPGANHVALGPVPGEDPRAYDPMTDWASVVAARWPAVNIDYIARTVGFSHESGWAYDTALPQDWVDGVKHHTGISPVGMGIVWAYGPRGTGYGLGAPFALTPEGAVLLAFFEHTQTVTAK